MTKMRLGSMESTGTPRTVAQYEGNRNVVDFSPQEGSRARGPLGDEFEFQTETELCRTVPSSPPQGLKDGRQAHTCLQQISYVPDAQAVPPKNQEPSVLREGKEILGLGKPNSSRGTNSEGKPQAQSNSPDEEHIKHKGKEPAVPQENKDTPKEQDANTRPSYRDITRGGKHPTPPTSSHVSRNFPPSQERITHLEFVEAVPTDEGFYTTPTDLEEIGRSMWMNSLVGYFMGRKLPFQAVNRIAHIIWGSRGLEEVIVQGEGVYLFKFKTADYLDEIMAQGQWHFARCPVILRKWYDGISLTPEEPKSMPIWIKLYGIPNSMSHTKGISFIASRFGRPLHTDSISEGQRRLDYARVCVEIEATKGICREGKFNKSNGQPYIVKPVYERLPFHCPTCQVFGHMQTNCPARKMENSGPSKREETPSMAPQWKKVARRRGKDREATENGLNEGPEIQKEIAEIAEARIAEPHPEMANAGNSTPAAKEIQKGRHKEEGKKGSSGVDTTPIHLSGEEEICETPPFGPIPQLLIESPQRCQKETEIHKESKQVKSVIVAKEHNSEARRREKAPQEELKASPSLGAKSKKKVKKRYT